MQRPAKNECAEFYHGYLDSVPQGDIFAILTEQLDETTKLIDSLDDEKARYRYAEGKWSIKEVLGHLIDAERVFCYRAMCFARHDAGPLPGMDENTYVSNANFDIRTLKNLYDEYSNQRRTTIAMFKGFSADALIRTGTASGCEFTVRACAFIIAGHERHHLDVLNDRYLA